MAVAIALSETEPCALCPQPQCRLCDCEGGSRHRARLDAGRRDDPMPKRWRWQRPGVEMMAGTTAYVSLEPCAHQSERGPACAEMLSASGISRVVIALQDPDPRTAGKGIALLRSKGVQVDILPSARARCPCSNGWLADAARARPPLRHAQARHLARWLHCFGERGRASGLPGHKHAPMPIWSAPAATRYWSGAAHMKQMPPGSMCACPVWKTALPRRSCSPHP